MKKYILTGVVITMSFATPLIADEVSSANEAVVRIFTNEYLDERKNMSLKCFETDVEKRKQVNFGFDCVSATKRTEKARENLFRAFALNRQVGASTDE